MLLVHLLAVLELADLLVDDPPHIIQTVLLLGFDSVCDVWLGVFAPGCDPTQNLLRWLPRTSQIFPKPSSEVLSFEMVLGVLQILGVPDVENVWVVIVCYFNMTRRAFGMEFFSLMLECALGQVDGVALLAGGFWVCRRRKEWQPLFHSHRLS